MNHMSGIHMTALAVEERPADSSAIPGDGADGSNIDISVLIACLTAYQRAARRFEVDAEAPLPTIRCWDSDTVEILVQSHVELGVAVELAAGWSGHAVNVLVPAAMMGEAHATFRSRIGSVRLQPYWSDALAVRFGRTEIP